MFGSVRVIIMAVVFSVSLVSDICHETSLTMMSI